MLPKGADITDAETRSALVLLFKQFVLATPKTRSLEPWLDTLDTISTLS